MYRKSSSGGGVGRRAVEAIIALFVVLAAAVRCAPDQTISPVDPSAAISEMSNSRGWGVWKQTLSIDPDSTTISEPGDTVRLVAILSSASNENEPPTLVDADWFVLDPEAVEIVGATNETRNVLLRGVKPGMARIVTVYDGLAALAHVSVGEGDPGQDPDTIPVAAAVSDPQSVLLVGDVITIRPNLLDEDSVVIPTEPSEWSADFDTAFLSVSEDFLVTALRPTPPGSSTIVSFTHIETELSVDAAIVVLPESDPGEWPDNEPAGMRPLLVVDGSNKDWPGFFQAGPWSDENRVAVVSDPDSKHGQAIEKRFFIGDQSGWNGVTYNGHDFNSRQLYFRIVFRLSANWQWHSGGSKFFYWGTVGRLPGQGPTQFYINATGGGVVQFTNQSASGERDSRGTFRGNAPPISRDQYHTIEVLHVVNTPGNADGSLRMWIDGTEVESFNHLGRPERSNVKLENLRWLDSDDTRLTGLQAFMFWGGQDDTKRVNDWIRLSELYISGSN